MNEPISDSSAHRGEWTSASNAQSDAQCPGRHLAQKGIPEKPSEWADFGTKIHAALAKGDPAGLEVEERDIYEGCLEVEKRVIVKYFGHEVAGLKATPVVEKREWIGFQPQGKGVNDGAMPMIYHSAQPDRVYRRGSKILIIEFKTLAGEVEESPSNMQLRDQMTVIWNKMKASGQNITEIGVAVVQPLVTHDPVICTYELKDFEISLELLFARVTASNDPESPRIAGVPQCDYCRAATRCEVYQRWAGGSVPQLAQSPLIDIPMAQWTPEQRAKACEALQIIDGWVTQAKDFLKQSLKQNPDSIPGWKVNEGRTIQNVTDPNELAQRFYKLGGNEEQFRKCVTVGKTKLSQQVSDLTGAVGVNLEIAVRELYKGICTETKSEGWLARKKEPKK